jgi:hypothetical protein
MVAPTTWLPQLYQRFQPFWDRAVPSAGLALLLWACSAATGAYPSEWGVFLAILLFVLGMGWPWVAYTAFTFLIAYPLYNISIYLAAIVLAALVLTSHWAVRNLGATVLVLITPVLLPWHMEATVPLLAGLWWGEWAGALAGGLAALWLKLLAGMAGQPLDLLRLSGWTPTGASIVDRFSGFNSLQTVMELVNPFGETSQFLLLHVLQVLAWVFTGYVTGLLARRIWPERWRGWAALLSVVPSSIIMWVGYVHLPGFLNLPPPSRAISLSELTAGLCLSALTAAFLRLSFLHMRRPLFRPRPRRSPSAQKITEPSISPASLPQRKEVSPVSSVNKTALNWLPNQRPRPAADKDDDVIMLEID